ncbi:hypothetical protein [Phocaeicola coprocola]|jgi:hypothetical protein|uniref:hypothetical protein n=1 Tax=Phocaeicola coprocola TaxID=310298 RepID=UPI00266C5E75|nr:hypothetical protein [Phocaeicola coprocola]
MTREDIKKAASEYANEACRPIWRSGKEQVCMIDFMEGAKWRINTVWHNSTEKPVPGKLLLVNTIYGEYDLCYYEVHIWNTVMTWVYMKDLIPNTEE